MDVRTVVLVLAGFVFVGWPFVAVVCACIVSGRESEREEGL